MTLGVITDVSAPVEIYDAVHAALLERVGSDAEGLLLHLARATEDGFQVIDVWASPGDRDRAQRELLGPVFAEVLQGRELPAPAVTEFEVRGLVLSRAGVTV